VAELRAKLHKRGAEKDEIEALLARLIELGLVDDARYARALAASACCCGATG